MPNSTESKWRLHGVRVPTLVIHGKDDILVPIENGRMVAAAVPGIKDDERGMRYQGTSRGRRARLHPGGRWLRAP